MANKNRLLSIICLSLILSSTSAQAFDPLQLRCIRQERQADQIFLSEIHFKKAGSGIARANMPNNFARAVDGEVLSFALHGTTKTFISGYSLFAVSYHDEMISGLTGDVVTGADGSFTLTRMNGKNNGIWKFVYSNKSRTKIEADFKCIYGGQSNAPSSTTVDSQRILSQAPSPSDIPSR